MSRSDEARDRARIRELEGRAWDVAVVGAGPAGALAALGLARRSLSVVLLDRQAFPRRKVCGACLSRGSLDVLSRVGLGALARDHGAVPLDRLELKAWGRTVELPLSRSSALSRTAFDAALVAEALRAGASFHDGTHAELGPARSGVREVAVRRRGCSGVLQARVVVAADGVGGSFLGASHATPSERVAPGSRIGLGAVFEAAPSEHRSGAIHMAVGSGGYVGSVHLEDGRLNVAAALDPALLRRVRSPGEAVAQVLAEAGAAPLPDSAGNAWRGTPPLTRRPGALGAERVFVVGDAAGYVEPFTGEGICWALASAWALTPFVARAVEGWTPDLLRDWESWHAREIGRAQLLCRGVAWVLRRPVLARGTVRALHHIPRVADPFLRGASTPPSLPLASSA
jgi:flavin-dependent dehydrogenase